MQIRTQQSGFSLIELLVALSLFTIVVTMAVGTLLILIDANAKAQNIQTAMTNLNFALDSMTREIRTGYGYYCDTTVSTNFRGDRNDVSDCAAGTMLSIIEGGESLTAGAPADQHRIEYRFNGTVIERRVCNSVPCNPAADQWQPVTSSDITINTLRFYVNDTEDLASGDLLQPTVTIYIQGEVGELDGVDTSFDIQTTVTQRQLDI